MKVCPSCPKCIKFFDVEDLILKMGGLLCPHCRLILVYPSNPVYLEELERRQENEN